MSVFDFATMGYLFGLMDLEEGQTFRLANIGRPPDLEPVLVPVRVGGMVEIPGEGGVTRRAREVTLTAGDRSTMITFLSYRRGEKSVGSSHTRSMLLTSGPSR